MPRPPRSATAPRSPRSALPAERERAGLSSQLAAAGPDITLSVQGHDVTLTSLDRVYWPAEPSRAQPAITKRDFLRYLLAVSPLILPHVLDRPLTLFRCPPGMRRLR